MACNKIPLIQEVNFEQLAYTTDKAINLFLVIKKALQLKGF